MTTSELNHLHALSLAVTASCSHKDWKHHHFAGITLCQMYTLLRWVVSLSGCVGLLNVWCVETSWALSPAVLLSICIGCQLMLEMGCEKEREGIALHAYTLTVHFCVSVHANMQVPENDLQVCITNMHSDCNVWLHNPCIVCTMLKAILNCVQFCFSSDMMLTSEILTLQRRHVKANSYHSQALYTVFSGHFSTFITDSREMTGNKGDRDATNVGWTWSRDIAVHAWHPNR